MAGLMQRFRRLWRHRWAEGQLSSQLPRDVLEQLEQLVAKSEQRHSSQIRICVEAGLPPSYIWREATARDRALALFGKLRVWDTEHNNGVLIYLLLADHSIEIIADRALDRTMRADEWDTLVSDMSAAFASGHYAVGLTAALERVSRQLEAHFPRQPGDAQTENDLPNAPVVQRRYGKD